MSWSSRVVVISAVLALGTLSSITLTTRSASADPDSFATQQLRRGFEYCDEGNAEKYISQRDVAINKDASIKTFTGKVGKYSVPENLSRCDKAMGDKSAANARFHATEDALQALSHACMKAKDEAGYEKYKQARAAFVATNGGSTSFALTPSGNASNTINSCDKDIPAKLAADKKNEEDIKATKAKQDADMAKSRAEAAAADKKTQKIIDSLKGAKKKIWDRRGWPTAPDTEAKVLKAVSWSYDDEVTMGTTSVGSYTAEHTALCRVTYTFGKGGVRTSKKGPGCRMHNTP